MINVENKKVTLKLQGQEVPVTYAELLKTVVNQPVKEGISLSDMRRNLTIMSTIEAAIENESETISFEKEHFPTVAGLVETSIWTINDLAILEFSEYIDSLKS